MIVDLKSKRAKEWTVFLHNKFSKKLIAFLSTETEGNHFRFSSDTDIILLVSEERAIEIKDIIYEEGANFVIPASIMETGEVKEFDSKYVEFQIAKVEFE